ncbi:hypothetical protein ACJ41O_009446 [Fusarium nematophilum]
MGHSCAGYYVNCTVQFNEQNDTVAAFGNVTRGHFAPDADTVLALVVPTGFGLFVSLVITIALVLDRIPGVYRFLRRRPKLRGLIPSPNQIPFDSDPPSDDEPLLHPTTSLPVPSPEPSPNYEQVPMHDYPVHSSEDLSVMSPHSAHHSQPTTPYYDGEFQQSPPQVASPAVSNLHVSMPPIPESRDDEQPQTNRNLGGPEAPSQRDYGRVEAYRLIPRNSPLQKQPSSTPPDRELSVLVLDADTLNYFSDRNTLSETRYDMLEAIMLCIPDSQILLSLSLALSFASRSKCTMSQYHMNIVIHLSLIACTNFCLAFTLVRNFWRSPVAGVLRLICFTGVLVFLMVVFIWQRRTGWTTESDPPSSRKDSLIILSAICFMQRHHMDGMMGLSSSEHDVIGRLTSTSNPFAERDLRAFLLIFVMFLITLGIRFYQYLRFRTNGPPRGPSNEQDAGFRGIPVKTWIIMAWWIFTWLVCGYIYIFATVRIFGFRSWVSDSGWMEPDEFSSNPENDVRGFGQTTPLVATAAIILAAMDTLKPRYTVVVPGK